MKTIVLSKQIGWLLIVSIILASCRSHPEPKPTLPELVDLTYSKAFKAQKLLEKQSSNDALSSAHTQQATQLVTAAPSPDAPRFNIAANEVPTANFFLSLVQELDANIVVHPEVTGTLSINLKEVTLEDILKAAQAIYGLHVEANNGVYFIYPSQLSTRIYQINYLNLKRTGSSSMTVSSGQITSSGETSTNTTNNSGTEITTETEVDFWQDIETTLTAIIGTETGGEVIVNAHSGIIVVKANQAEHRSVEALLDRVQANLRRQVVIEAKILEVTLSDSFQSGIQWQVLGTPGASSTITDSDGNTVSDGKFIFLDQAKSNVLNQQNDLEGLFSVNLALSEFSTIIDMLETQGEVKVLSSPRISTVNNQKAVIKVGTDEFFVTEVSQTTTTSATADPLVSPEVTLTPFFSGIALDVTPQISQNQEVILHVHPTVSEVIDGSKTINLGDAGSLNLPLALSNIRETDSIIKARNKEVVILGGLLKTNESNINANIPWASKLPIFGNFFKQSQVITEKSELVILLKPIVVENFTWRTLLEDSQKYLNQPSVIKKLPSTTAVFK